MMRALPHAGHARATQIDFYLVLLMVFGAVVLLPPWFPLVSGGLPWRFPFACIALGAGLSWSVFAPLSAANPLTDIDLTRRLTEFVVIVALFGAGLKID